MPATDASPLRVLDVAAATLVPGTRIDAYEIAGLLGAGGMGEVYRARDPRLSRDVAIKIVRRDLLADGRGRLLREAQALARLSHPNVVAVFDVGELGEGAYVAMEYVEGRTLRAWLAAAPRTRPEVIDVFVAAGRGLAAAHHAGLVHRDFKPDNVLVGPDGRPRVVDFGLSGRAGGAARGSGTPGYMAPEKVVDARADQYAFAAALHEALAGALPAGGAVALSLPVRLRGILARALDPLPERRFPGMDELLVELSRDPAARWRRALALAGVAGVTAAVVLALAPRAGDRCAAAGRSLRGVWDEAARGAVAAAFRHRSETFARVAEELDHYAGAWTAMRREACEATELRHEQSPQLLDLRMGCLDRRRGELAALTDLLARADDGIIDGAVQAAGGLGELADCADAAALTAAYPPPADAAARRELAELRAPLDRATALLRAGQVKRALPLARELAQRARAVDHPPALAEAAGLLAELAVQAGDRDAEALCYQAMQAAARARDDDRVAEAWIALVVAVGSRQARYADALALRPAAEAAIARAGDKPRQQAGLLSKLGLVLSAAGRGDEAQAACARAVELEERAAGPDALELAPMLTRLANVLQGHGKHRAARLPAERALAILEAHLGRDHPLVAAALRERAPVARGDGRWMAQEWYARAAVAIFERDVGPGNPDQARALVWLGNALHRQGRLDEARAVFRRVLAMRLALFGPVHLEVGMGYFLLGSAEVDAGRPLVALPLFEAALAAFRVVLPPNDERIVAVLDHQSIALRAVGRVDLAAPGAELAVVIGAHGGSGELALRELAELRSAQGRHDEAIALARRVLALRVARLGADDELVAQSLQVLGRLLLAAGRPAEALPLEQMALAMRTAEDLGFLDSDRDDARAAMNEALAAFRRAPARRRN